MHRVKRLARYGIPSVDLCLVIAPGDASTEQLRVFAVGRQHGHLPRVIRIDAVRVSRDASHSPALPPHGCNGCDTGNCGEDNCSLAKTDRMESTHVETPCSLNHCSSIISTHTIV